MPLFGTVKTVHWFWFRDTRPATVGKYARYAIGSDVVWNSNMQEKKVNSEVEEWRLNTH